MRLSVSLLYVGFIACIIFQSAYASKKHKKGEKVAAVQAVEKSEKITTTTESVVEEIVEEETVEVVTQWQGYFIDNFAAMKSAEKKSIEWKDIVSECFSKTIGGYTIWDRVIKKTEYVEYIAVSTGFKGNYKDIAKLKEHCVQIAASKPQLIALTFKGLSKNIKNPKEKLTVCKLARKKYNIGEKVIEVKQTWKTRVISDFYTWKSAQFSSKELSNKCTEVLNYDTAYFDKFIAKKIYAEFLSYATGYKGDIKNVKELKKHLITTAKKNGRLCALALKSLSKNLKNPKVPLKVAKLATTKYGIKEKTCKKVDWKSHFINEFNGFQSTQKFKHADQILRVKSILNYKADSGTILDLLIKRTEYRNFLAESIGYNSESKFDEKKFREYVSTTAELHPFLFSVSFRSICKNLKSGEKLVVSPSAQKYIKEKLGQVTKSEKKTTKKTTKTKTTTTEYKKWQEFIIMEFSSLKSCSENSDEVKNKIKKFLGYSANGYTCLEKIIKVESYASYLAHVTSFKGDYKDTTVFVKHLTEVGNKKPRLLLSGVKGCIKNIKNPSEKLTVGRAAKSKFGIKEKVFENKLSFKTCAIQEFSTRNSESGDSTELGKKVLNLIKTDETYFTKLLEKTEYRDFICTATGYKGKKEAKQIKNYFTKLCSDKPRLAFLTVKSLGTAFKTKKFVISSLAKKKYNIQETTIVKTDWSSYAFNNFVNIKTKEAKAHLTKAKLKKLVGENDGLYLEKILGRTVYSEYIAKVTGYKGDCKDKESLKKFFLNTIEKHPLLAASCIKNIVKNQQDGTSELKISSYAKEILQSTTTKSSSSVNTKTTTTQQYPSVKYAISNFANRKLSNIGSHKIKAIMNKLIDLEYGDTTYLDAITTNEKYASYISTTIGFNGDYKNTKQLKEVIKKTIQSNPRQLVECIKYIARNQQDPSVELVITKNAKKTTQTAASSTSSSTSTSTTKTTEYSYIKSLKQFKSITETRNSAELKKICENFRTAENGAALQELLKIEDIYDFLVDITRYTGQQNKSAFCNFLVNDFFNKRPKFAALLLQKVYLYLESQSPLEPPEYCTNHWKTEEKTVKKSSSSSSVTSSSSTTKSISKSTSGFLGKFASLNSCSDEKPKAITFCNEFIKGSYLEEILKDEKIAKYLSVTLDYGDDYKSDQFKSFIKKTIIKERPVALALCLKKIYYSISEDRKLAIPTYVSKKYNIVSTEYSVTEHSSTTTSTSSSSIYTSSSSSADLVASETVAIELEEEDD